MKKEYNKIHERYTELLRSHCDLMERVKIMFGTDEAANGNNMPSLSNLAGTLRTNLHRLGSQDDGSYAESFNAITSNETSEPMSILPQRHTDNMIPRQAWIETEMSYDDTTTIIEDVEELQRDKDKDKDLRDRDHSLSGKFALVQFAMPPGLVRLAIISNNRLSGYRSYFFRQFPSCLPKENMCIPRSMPPMVKLCLRLFGSVFFLLCFPFLHSC